MLQLALEVVYMVGSFLYGCGCGKYDHIGCPIFIGADIVITGKHRVSAVVNDMRRCGGDPRELMREQFGKLKRGYSGCRGGGKQMKVAHGVGSVAKFASLLVK